jgi:hypothetical protein
VCSVADPDPGSGMGKQSGSRSGMRNPDHISESLTTKFWVNFKILKFFYADPPGWKKFGSGIRDKHLTCHPALAAISLF